MGVEKLEVLFSSVENKSYAHSFLLYTDSSGHQFIARGGPSSQGLWDYATGNSRLNTGADSSGASKDAANISVPSAFRTTVSTGSEAAADWKQIQTFAEEVNGQYGYHASQNSNSFTHAALTSVGKGDLAFPSGIQPADVIGWTNPLGRIEERAGGKRRCGRGDLIGKFRGKGNHFGERFARKDQ